MREVMDEQELNHIPPFDTWLQGNDFGSTKDTLEIMQINVGKVCNLACKHCHVEAGPHRTEAMDLETMKACLLVCEEQDFLTIDITGGAPEMNPNFRWLVEQASATGRHVIVRTNLVILLEEPYTDLPEFYAEHKVEIVCSLPHYAKKDTDRQRGSGVYEKSIQVLKKLNALGYGKDKDLVLNMVYNPGGAFFPPEQTAIEKEYKERLFKEYGIVFDHVFTITNNPIGRFKEFLKRSGNLKVYMDRLYGAFNADTLETIMCRNQLSVGFNGDLYDCDFNQAAGLHIETGQNIRDLVGKPYRKRNICVGKHCYACTAGQGSSCGGATEK